MIDLANYPKWMEACVRLSQTSPGALRRGAALHYVHNTGGRKGEMSGVVTTVEHDRALKLNFDDSAFAVVVGFSTEAVEDGTRVTHFIDIDPKSLFGTVHTNNSKGKRKAGRCKSEPIQESAREFSVTVQTCQPITSYSGMLSDSGQAAQACLVDAERLASPVARNSRPFLGLSTNDRETTHAVKASRTDKMSSARS